MHLAAQDQNLQMSPSIRTASKSFLYLFFATFAMAPALSAPTATIPTIPTECSCSASPLSSAALDYVLRMAVARDLTPAECAFICNPSPPLNQGSVLALAPRRRQRMAHNRAPPGRASPNLIAYSGKAASPPTRKIDLSSSGSSSTLSSAIVEQPTPTLVLDSIKFESAHHAESKEGAAPTAMDSPQTIPSMSLDLRPHDTNLLVPFLDPTLLQPSNEVSALSEATHLSSDPPQDTASTEDTPSTPTTSLLDLLIPSPIPPPSAPSMTSLPASNPPFDAQASPIPLSCPLRVLGSIALIFIFVVLFVEFLGAVRVFMGVVDRTRRVLSPTKRIFGERGKGKIASDLVRIRTKEISGEKVDLEGGSSGSESEGSESEGSEDGDWVRFGAGKTKTGRQESVDGWC